MEQELDEEEGHASPQTLSCAKKRVTLPPRVPMSPSSSVFLQGHFGDGEAV